MHYLVVDERNTTNRDHLIGESFGQVLELAHAIMNGDRRKEDEHLLSIILGDTRGIMACMIPSSVPAVLIL